MKQILDTYCVMTLYLLSHSHFEIIFLFFSTSYPHLNAYFAVHPLPPERMPSYDEKSDPFLFQSLFSPLISAFVALTVSVSLYALWCIFSHLTRKLINLTLAVFAAQKKPNDWTACWSHGLIHIIFAMFSCSWSCSVVAEHSLCCKDRVILCWKDVWQISVLQSVDCPTPNFITLVWPFDQLTLPKRKMLSHTCKDPPRSRKDLLILAWSQLCWWILFPCI